ncbi:MAG: hypothetical protein ACP5HG_18350 [Anaerolineae bacterium]
MLVSGDDGVHADATLDVNGGYVAVDARGDGLDINGPIRMTGGVVLVNGPTANFNGAVDYFGSFEITGGFLVAVGSAGMAQVLSATSTQYSVRMTLPTMQRAGTLVHVETEEGRGSSRLCRRRPASRWCSAPPIWKMAPPILSTPGAAPPAR